MGNVYSAQNVAAYFIYELNDMHTFINGISLQHLLAEVEEKWIEKFGHSAFLEKATYTLASKGYVVEEVFEAYKENGKKHIALPAKEWFLKYGEFQLVSRTYGVPPYTEEEEQLVKAIIKQYENATLKKVS